MGYRIVELSTDSRKELRTIQDRLAKELWNRWGLLPRTPEVMLAQGTADHWQIWAVDILWDACKVLLTGEEARFALRMLLTAHEYKGHNRGFWGSTVTDDAAGRIGALIADVLDGEVSLIKPARCSPPANKEA